MLFYNVHTEYIFLISHWHIADKSQYKKIDCVNDIQLEVLLLILQTSWEGNALRPMGEELIILSLLKCT